ncbi:hypothetical protein NKR19_g300 [Coniochaeta hoffmannii]|uniref:Uncharacterized protein n=1 Tax=Coniochaeta hoffmannii TaxID=91930 RepID=A0AA38S1S2_9PEZI|nr:hypothetical protein NKR19_g300 [Coniochaeta hoffmannii]
MKEEGFARTTPGIPRWSPTRVLVWRSSAYLGESGRDPEFSDVYGRTWKETTAELFMSCWLNDSVTVLTRGGRHSLELCLGAFLVPGTNREDPAVRDIRWDPTVNLDEDEPCGNVILGRNRMDFPRV